MFAGKNIICMEGKYMLFNEKEMRELCKRYDIEIINGDDKDYYNDTEFSMNDIMDEPYIHPVIEKMNQEIQQDNNKNVED